MTEAQKIAARVSSWARAAPVLAKVRDDDIRGANTHAAFTSLRSLVSEAVKKNPPKPTSGLVEQQRLFRLVSSGE